MFVFVGVLLTLPNWVLRPQNMNSIVCSVCIDGQAVRDGLSYGPKLPKTLSNAGYH